jgi:hypothetical protein
MNLLGKILCVAIFLLSVSFAVLSLAVNASHGNWRDIVMDPNQGLRQQVEQIERTNQQLREARQRTEEALAREQAARRTALAALQTQLDQRTQLLQQSEETVQQLEARNTVLTQLDRSRAEELARLTEANTNLEQQIRQEREDRDTLFAQVLELTDRNNSLIGLLDVEQERNTQLVSQLTRYTEVLDARGIRAEDPIDGAPPERRGRVLVVNQPRRLVEISIGYDEGLREGHTLHVTRSGRYMGKLQVRRTEPDRAVAEILDSFLQGPIREGDRVDTSIE